MDPSGSLTLDQVTQSLINDVNILTDYLVSAGHPLPSTDRDTPIFTLPDDAPSSAHLARYRILDQAQSLLQLAAGPSEYLSYLQTDYQDIGCLRWLCQYGIFSLVPLQGAIGYADLAAQAKVSEVKLKSVVRMAITNGLFVEESPNNLAHSARSALLQTNPSFHDWASFSMDAGALCAFFMVDADRKWPDLVDTCHTAFNIACSTDLPFFKYIGENSERHRQFSGFMRAMTSGQDVHLNHLVNGWNWDKLGQALVVDLGGSTGHASIALARKFPDLTFIVEDLPEVIAGGPKYLASQEDAQSLRTRVSYKAHSFFDPQPVQDADVYFFRMVMHNWSDDDSVRILTHLVKILKPGACILIMDVVLPDPGTMPASKERLLRVRDLNMLQVFNNPERHIEGWKAIFSRVDKRLVVKEVGQSAGSVLSIIELSLED
ncbi:uncharacterized protein N7482_005632 [Penicillium canariense]|uniref:O-methyltransferase C-terminal domain-containing protein n=1 Tax=Penicillium canariense TaxID=189055 RepID=A0A9W9I2X4_9EURO|nr:uncharacterized protein N7482_005632 [Penicillium canariense]KAJ5166851.1 hypothetical protein N7482_005632 [Penicillium canariense]